MLTIILASCMNFFILAQSVAPIDSINSSAFRKNKKFESLRFYPAYSFSYQLWQKFNLIKDANNGDAVAQHELGIRYLLGDGFEPDTSAAIDWISKSANQKYYPALYNLSIMYLNGTGVDWNPFTSFSLMNDAAELGMREAQYALGLFYSDNLIVKKDMELTFYWLRKASSNGYSLADEVMHDFINAGYKPKPTENGESTFGKKNNSASSTVITPSLQSNVSALTSLVYLDLSDDSLKSIDKNDIFKSFLRHSKINFDSTDISKSIEEFSFSKYLQTINKYADYGNPECLTMLGYIYSEGLSVEKNLIKGAEYYFRAIRCESPNAPQLFWQLSKKLYETIDFKREANKGNVSAKYIWAGLINLGFEGDIFKSDAVKLLKEASANGHIFSQIELGINLLNSQSEEKKNDGINLWREVANTTRNYEAYSRLHLAESSKLQNIIDIDSIVQRLFEINERGGIFAQLTLAHFYENGIGLQQNLGLASNYYRQAAARGSRIGIKSLIRLYNSKRPADLIYRLD